jgi:hypothetical protein
VSHHVSGLTYRQAHRSLTQRSTPPPPSSSSVKLPLSNAAATFPPATEQLSAAAQLDCTGYVVVPMHHPTSGVALHNSARSSPHLQMSPVSGEGVVISMAWNTDAVVSPATGQVRKVWQGLSGSETLQRVGQRTFARAFNPTSLGSGAANECAAVIAETLRVRALWSGTPAIHRSQLLVLQNESDAPGQMLHYDIPMESRSVAVTVDCAISETFSLRIVNLSHGAEELVVVPRGSMCVLGGSCFHGGTSASGVGPRVFGVVQHKGGPIVKAGTFPR